MASALEARLAGIRGMARRGCRTGSGGFGPWSFADRDAGDRPDHPAQPGTLVAFRFALAPPRVSPGRRLKTTRLLPSKPRRSFFIRRLKLRLKTQF